MMTTFPALYISQRSLDARRGSLAQEPLRSALPQLEQSPADPLARAQLLALRYLLWADAADGRAAAALLPVAPLLPATAAPSALQRQLGWLDVLAMLREQAGARAYLAALPQLSAQLPPPSAVAEPLPRFWTAAVTLAAGMLLDDAGLQAAAATEYRAAIDQHIHPEGYFKGIVDGDDARQSYAAQLSATAALVQMAQMAAQIELDLWGYNKRAVSVITAATYTFYYYFFPERWRWQAGLQRSDTTAIMREQGAFYEMVQCRSPLRGGEQLLAEQRPFFSCSAGATTLTHGQIQQKKKRWRLF